MADRFDKTCIVAVNASYSHSSLSARCLYKALNENAFVCEYTINDNVAKVAAELYKQFCGLYAFSCYIWNIDFILDVCKILKTATPDCVILLGGPEVSYDAQDLMRKNEFIDFILCGEGEISIKNFVLGKDYKDIDGLVYRQENDIIANPPKTICDLDKLNRLYTKKDILNLDNKMLYYETSRGCPFSCSYCLSSVSKGVRFFSLERVFEDLKLFMDCGVKLVKLTDRTFNIDKERTKKILRFIIENNLNTCFHFEISADILDEETILIFNSAPKGYFQLEIGIQSTNEEVLSAINRKTNIEKLKENVKCLQSANNMHIHLDLIAGLPCEDYLSFQKSFNDVFSLRPDMLQLGFLKLLKGTSIRDKADKYDYKYTPKAPYEVISNKIISYDEILKLKDVCEIIEKYYNSASFTLSLEMALGFFDSAYDFFCVFASYWNKNGLFSRPQSKKTLYEIFCNFYNECINNDNEIFYEKLKFDFIKNNKNASLPSWAPRMCDKAFYSAAYEFLKSESGRKYIGDMSDDKIAHIMSAVKVEKFNFDITDTNEFVETVIFFNYEKNSFTKIEEKF